MRQQTAEGIILKRRNSGETDRILTIFTKRQGKIVVKAVGVRKIHSKRASHIELLNHVAISLYQGKGMSILTEAATIDSYQEIRKDLQTIGYAYYLCELVCELCPENEEQGEIFELLHQTLVDLSKGSVPLVIIHRFEQKLLTILGYRSARSFVQLEDHGNFIEEIIEKKLKTRQILPKLI